MIDLITSRDLEELTDVSADHCVSLLLPTYRSGPDTAEAPIRLKNLLSRAASELVSLGERPPDADQLLSPATALLHDSDFWAHQDSGLVIYLTADSMRTFRLPQLVQELVVVADRFHLNPLISCGASAASFHVLALSQHEIRLLRGSRTHVSEIGLGDIPRSMGEALRFDDRERQVHSHGADRVGRGRVSATFHGHGGTKDTTKEDLARFFRMIDDSIVHLIPDPATPLVLAGVEQVTAAYRNTSRYQEITAPTIEGNPERLTATQIHDRAWPIVEPLLDRDRDLAAARFLAGTPPTSSAPPEILAAALGGRVDTLFVPLDTHLWGTFDPAGGLIEQHEPRQPGDHDLFDVAAVETHIHHGSVYPVPLPDVPGVGPLAAILRY